jgi:type II secretion system protein N
MMRWVIGSLGGAIWSSIVFAVGMMMFFPGDWVKEQISYQVQNQTNKKMLVHIGEAHSSGLFGVGLKDVNLYESKRGRRKAGQPGTSTRENTLIGSFNALSLSPSIAGLFSGTLGASVGLELDGGDLGADFGIASSALRLSTDIEDFQLAAHPITMEDTDVELSGLLSLISDVTIDRDDIKNSSGEIELNINNLALKRGMISGFELTETAFSESVLEMVVEDGKAKVKKGKFTGDLIDATIDGHITLRKDLSRSRLVLKIQVRFDETLDKLASMMLKSARDDEGVYHFKGQGTLMNPRFRPDRSKRRSAFRGSRDARDKDEFLGEDEDERKPRKRRRSSRAQTDEEREERRAKRKERLKKRRERMQKRREDRRARQAEEGGRDYDRGADVDRFYGRRLELGDVEPPPPVRNLPYEDEDDDRDYRNQNDYGNGNNNINDNDYGNANDYPNGNFNNDDDYGDPNDPNGNMEDLGYLDE